MRRVRRDCCWGEDSNYHRQTPNVVKLRALVIPGLSVCLGRKQPLPWDLALEDVTTNCDIPKMSSSRQLEPADETKSYDRCLAWASNSRSRTTICASTIPKRFNSPQQVKAKCFTVLASAFGCVECSSIPISTNNAPADSSPAPQIISANASILSLPERSSSALGAGSTSPGGTFEP